MALTYRALLVPTAALDSAGRAKPDAEFSVTPMAGGSPVAVYAAAQGGSALAADQIKTDSLGNISGFYVAEPGPYTLAFAGGGTVVTSAVMDSRDVTTPGDLADALVADGFTEVPVENWVPFVNTPTTESLPVGSMPHLTLPDPLLSDPAGGWITGPDVAVDADTGKLLVTNAGLYLVTVDSSQSTYARSGDLTVGVPVTEINEGGYNAVNLNIASPRGWGTALTNTFRIHELNGESRCAHTLYLPVGATLSLTLSTDAKALDNYDISWVIAKLAVSLTRFAPAT